MVGLEVGNHHCSFGDHIKHPHTRGGGIAMKVDAFGIAGSKTLIGDFTVLLGQRASHEAAKRNSNRAKSSRKSW
jgi:hypothetical protein